MFDRYVRLAQARKAQKDGHFEEVLRLLDDPAVRDQRRTAELRDAAVAGLLERARRRAASGAFAEALHDCARVLDVRPGHAPAEDVRREIEASRDRRRDAAGRAATRLGEVAALIAEGRLDTAGSRLDEAAATGVATDDATALRSRIDAQRARVERHTRAASAAIEAGDGVVALEELAQARALDREDPKAERERARLAERLAARLARDWSASIETDGAVAVWQSLDSATARVPELERTRDVRELRRQLRQLVRQRVFGLLERCELDTLETELRVVERAGVLGEEAADELIAGMARDAVLHRDGADPRAAAEAFERIASECRSEAARREARRHRDLADDCERGLDRAHDLVADGRANEARAELVALLERAPRHDGLLAALDRVDRTMRGRDESLRAARSSMDAGRLEEAAQTLTALSIPGSEGEAARILLRDVQRRIDLADRGVREVQRRLHGRESRHRDGLATCRERLVELGSTHADHPEIPRLIEAIDAEIRGLDVLAQVEFAVRADDPVRVAEQLEAFVAVPARLLSPERLEARLLAALDGVLGAAEAALDHGRPRRASAWVDAVPADFVSPVAERLQAIRSKLDRRFATAADLVQAARAALDGRDLDAARAALERAEEEAVDDDDVRRVRREHDALVARCREVETVRDLATEADVGVAAARLERMGPTPAMLRTRIFDLKRDLVRRQGLGGAFLLRVDEGGEFLVFRGESVSIGNLRDRRADLPVLANLSGVHARLARTMSFHGGQRDSIRSESGMIYVDGRAVDDVVLVPGSRVRLGDRLELEYGLPSTRSLSASLRLRGGFRIAGTERLLWLKDRGRDGRILIGAVTDAHVPVDSATGEVEVFADRDGRLKVACRDGGTIDGKPFRDEHPLEAGAVVECGGVSFVVSPWQK